MPYVQQKNYVPERTCAQKSSHAKLLVLDINFQLIRTFDLKLHVGVLWLRN